MTFSKKTIVIFTLFIVFFAPPSDAKGIKRENGDNNIFANQALLHPVFEKLYNLEKSRKGKVNIVHIGDSHIQADFFTNAIRQPLQAQFGNSGIGFTFPYSLVGTNGPRCAIYTSNATWQSQPNISPVADVGVGLSGIALYTSAQDFILQLTARTGYEFNTVKIIYPTIEPQYKMSVTTEPLLVSSSSTQKRTTSATGYKYHKVKGGETLSGIARRYGSTLAQIKKANNLKSDKIRAGQNIKVPSKTSRAVPKVEKSNILKTNIKYVEMESKPYYSSYSSDTTLNRITLLPAERKAMYNLNGFVIENDKAGVVYHSIGVNGAKLSDYIKYPLFFKQLPILEPDLIILSFGTNESFGKMSDSDYIFQLREFVNNIAKSSPDAVVLVMTPPPSMFRRRRINTYISDYSIALMGMTNLPVWDLYSRMGGTAGITPKGRYAQMIARDKVHYTAGGYQAQGQLFVSDFIKAYNYYINNANQ